LTVPNPRYNKVDFKNREKIRMNFSNLRNRWALEQEERKRKAALLRRILTEKGIPVFKKYGIQRVILFGSIIKEMCTETSDIDILVTPLDNNNYWKFLHEIEDVVNSPIDLYTDNDDSVFVQKIIERGEVFYEV
jgi:predicted nucleotidyltransferase